MAEDYAFVDKICSALSVRADQQGLDALSESERVALLAWWAKAIIDNGGFEYFYEGAANASAVADAFAILGLSDAAEACRRSLTAFPNGLPPHDHELRRQWIEQHRAEIGPLFDELNPIIWDLDDRLYTALAAYIREHAAEFRELVS